MTYGRLVKFSLGATVICLTIANSASAQDLVTYGGGRVVSHVKAVAVMWGPNVAPSTKASIGNYLQVLTDSQYMDSLDEYYTSSFASSTNASIAPIGRGVLSSGNIYQITPHNTSTTLIPGDIETELNSQIGVGFPVPTSETLYMVYFPPGMTLTFIGWSECNPASPTPWCGYHISHSYGNVTYTFAVFPDMGPTSPCGNQFCGPLDPFGNEALVSSHEMAEAITDPEDDASWAGNTEIGDPCNYHTIGSAAVVNFQAQDGRAWVAQSLWSDKLNRCTTGLGVPKCQETSQTFGIQASGSNWGFAPPEVQQWYTGNHCTSSPIGQVNLCQNASDIYGMQPGSNGFAPTSVVNWFLASSCRTIPLVSEALCQRASDAYGIVANSTWGSAPSYVQGWWIANSCQTSAAVLSPCQRTANLYGIKMNTTWGFAPPDVQSDWQNYRCMATSTSSTALVCQNAANMFGIVANTTWGSAPANVATWWTQTGCGGAPQCQGISNLLATTASVTWGLAPSGVQTFWIARGCGTAPQFGVGDKCQTIANNFGSVSGSESPQYGFLPNNSAIAGPTWWAQQCVGAYSPKNDTLRQYTIGPYGQ
jgi:hypothetical protein